jgi:beta-galactosidase
MKRRTFLGSTAGAVVAVPLADWGRAFARPVGQAGIAPVPSHATGVGNRLSFDDGWRFFLGDMPLPYPTTGETYGYTKAGAATGPAGYKYDDTGWRVVDLPHDFVVEQPFAASANGDQGSHPKGVGWYRKSFTLPASDRGKHIELQLDGMATTATVWFNGDVVRHNWSGYDSAYIDLTPFAHFGGEPNVIAVRVDSTALQGWWYEGGGLYRHAWLVKRSPVHLITDGVYADPRMTADGWVIPFEATVRNIGEKPVEADVAFTVVDPNGRVVARGHAPVMVDALGEMIAAKHVYFPEYSPLLWSIEEPNLYEIRTMVSVDGKNVDSVTTTAGFRTIRFDRDRGFFLNDKPVKLQGTCNHQDHAGVGVALPDSIIEFRLRKLKELGCNALRMSHNAPARELLDVADRLGMLVMDENRLFNPSPDYLAMLQWMVRRDRNHPSIILWSVFNEEPLQGTPEGYEMVRRMAAAVKELDKTRPVTAAMNGVYVRQVSVADAVDVIGLNYHIDGYDKLRAATTKPITSSEDTSAVMTRGEYATDEARHVLDCYDDHAPEWGNTHRVAWKAIATRPFVAGCFVWTGFDYRGEPTPFKWPTISSNFGIMDTCGFPKSAYFIRQAQWVHDRPVLHLVPHWNWTGREGQPIRVMAMSNADTVELRLNGRALGTQAVDPFEMNSWQVPYAPGRLEAVARKGGRIVATTAVETTGAPVSLRLTPDRASLAGDGRDAVPVTVEAVDSKGRHVSTANLPVQFETSGGRIIGVGNGDPNSHEPDKGSARRLYNGYAQLIVQSNAGDSAALMVRATSPGVRAATARLRVEPIPVLEGSL